MYDFDTELLAVKTQARIDAVLLHIENGWDTDWEFVEEEAARAVAQLRQQRLTRAFRAVGESMAMFGTALQGIAEAFATAWREALTDDD